MPSPHSPTISSSAKVRLAALSIHMSSNPSVSAFEAVPLAPTDPLFGLITAYKADTNDKKVDLGVGAYRDENSKPWVLPVVKKAHKLLGEDPNFEHEYLGIAGLPSMTAAAATLIFGKDSPAIQEKRVTSLQTVSGTGALHLGAAFFKKFYPAVDLRPVYLSSPTWANHNQIFTNVHHTVANYPYWSAFSKGLDLEGMLSALQNAPERSIIVLHACAHNPTGVDPTQEQWKKIAEVVKARNHFPFFDLAYQGFASGSLDQDAWAVRYFIDQGLELCVAQSFAKNFGLYGERAGCFHFVTPPSPNAEEVSRRLASQLAILQRSEISNPPAYGAKIVNIVLSDQKLFSEWEEDLRTMSGRIKDMRKALFEKLQDLGTPGNWEHIVNQIGMFSFTGLTENQVKKIINDYHVYLTKNGRISMAGLNSKNVDYFAHAIDKTVREVKE